MVIQYNSFTRGQAARTPVTVLDAPEQMNVPGWRLHNLTSDLEGFWSVSVNEKGG